MKLILGGTVLSLLFLTSGCGPRLPNARVEPLSREEQLEKGASTIVRVDSNEDNGNPVRVNVGTTIDYSLRWPVSPPFVSDLKTEVKGGVSEARIFEVSHFSDGRLRLGSSERSIQVKAQRVGEASVIIRYTRGDKKIEKTFKLVVIE